MVIAAIGIVYKGDLTGSFGGFVLLIVYRNEIAKFVLAFANI